MTSLRRRERHSAIEHAKTGVIINYVPGHVYKPYSHRTFPRQSRHNAPKKARAWIGFELAKEDHRFLLRQQPLTRREADPTANATTRPTFRHRRTVLVSSRSNCAAALQRSLERHRPIALESEDSGVVRFELSLRERSDRTRQLASLGDGAFRWRTQQNKATWGRNVWCDCATQGRRRRLVEVSHCVNRAHVQHGCDRHID
jgi:hypothetical protein